jgi:hypothetical protein
LTHEEFSLEQFQKGLKLAQSVRMAKRPEVVVVVNEFLNAVKVEHYRSVVVVDVDSADVEVELDLPLQALRDAYLGKWAATIEYDERAYTLSFAPTCVSDVELSQLGI